MIIYCSKLKDLSRVECSNFNPATWPCNCPMPRPRYDCRKCLPFRELGVNDRSLTFSLYIYSRFEGGMSTSCWLWVTDLKMILLVIFHIFFSFRLVVILYTHTKLDPKIDCHICGWLLIFLGDIFLEL